MSAFPNFRRVATVAGATFCLAAVCAGTASAAPAVLYPSLTIVKSADCGSSKKFVGISATAKMSQVEAQRFIDHPGDEVDMRLWGEDPAYDDLVHGPVAPTRYVVNTTGLLFEWSGCVANSRLNEDWGGDELFATIAFHDFRDGTVGLTETNRVHGNY